ncbi:tRNA-dihydrouridine synthase family protein [Desulfocurvus vexinensis]|uniref:tRNA dihydrouridine synthase n=1 Tax=Desulfocurvus vexinensis TaxID=399548 RepID=UPI0004B72E4F
MRALYAPAPGPTSSPPVPMHHPDSPPITADAPWLAPLAGFSDLPFRLLCREHGAAVAVTEMVSAKGLCHDSSGTADLLATTPADAPLVVQLFGSEPQYIERAVGLLLERGFGWFDLNAGCPVRKVVKTGAGAALHNDPDLLVALAGRMAALAGPGRCGVKLRRGWAAGQDNYLELGRRLADAGTAWLALHPRHARQGYSGEADWACLAALARAVDIPVIASGDLFDPEAGARCVRETGVAGVMFARGALYGPSIFARYRALLAGRELPAPAPAELAATIRRHAALAREHLRERHALLQMRTIVPRYVRHMPGARALRARLVQCRTWDELDALVSAFLLDSSPQ